MFLFVRVPPDILGRRPVQVRRCTLPAVVRPAAARPSSQTLYNIRLCVGPSPNAEAGKDGEEQSSALATKPASGTLLGRIVIEILALVVGVILLVFVAIWKCINVLTLYVWRALMWLANVRRLGRWACGRAIAVASAMTNSPGQIGGFVFAVWHMLVTGVSALFHRVVTGMTSVFAFRKDRHVTVRSARVLDDEQLVSKKELDDVQREIQRMRDMIEKGGAGIAVGDRASVQNAHAELTTEAPVTVSTVKTPANSIAKDKSRLILLRHAKSAWDRSGKVDDHDRDLSPVGEEEAELVGRELTRRGWLYDGIVCSDARRTTQTLDLIAATGGTEARKEGGKIVITESLYFAVSGDEMAVAVDKEVPLGSLRPGTTTLVVCHSPGCEELVECLTGEKPEIGTACAALLEFPRDDIEAKRQREIRKDETLQLTGGRKEWTLVDVVRPAMLK